LIWYHTEQSTEFTGSDNCQAQKNRTTGENKREKGGGGGGGGGGCAQ